MAHLRPQCERQAARIDRDCHETAGIETFRWNLAPNIFRAMAQAAPDRVQAFTGLPVPLTVYGQDGEGRTY
jgi:hypothetical protein